MRIANPSYWLAAVALLAASAAVAAKLRQLAPHLRQALVAEGFADVELRIKVSPG